MNHRQLDQRLVLNEDAFFKTLYLGNTDIQSKMLIAEPDKLVLPYTQHMMSSLIFNPQPLTVLMIGLGGGAIVKYMHKNIPHCSFKVVEKSAKVIQTAFQSFDLPQNDKIEVIHADGADYVQTEVRRDSHCFDIIFVDAFDDSGMAPSVYNYDTFSLCRSLLTNKGVLVVNTFFRQKPMFYAVINDLRRLWGPQLLRLKVRGTTNEIALGVNDERLGQDWSYLAQQLKMTANFSDLPLREYFKLILEANVPFWRRWGIR